jgi:hypothetical protein
LSNLFKFIQTCSAEFTVQAEFTVHLGGLSVNSASLSAKSVGIHRFGISLFIFLTQMDFGRFLPNSADFFQKPDGSEGANFLVCVSFLNIEPGLPRIILVGSFCSKRNLFFSSIVIKDPNSEEISEGFAVAL